MQMWPLVDPVTAALLALGIAGVLVHALRPVLLLTLAGFAVHVLGTLVLTGNFDVARVGGSGGGSSTCSPASARPASPARSPRPGAAPAAALALAALAAAIAGAAVWNTAHLFTFWGSTEVRRAHRNNLAYLSIWVRNHRRPDERVLGAGGAVHAGDPEPRAESGSSAVRCRAN